MNNKLTPSEPLVSVVMCTYNGSSFIDEQLNSIVNQTYKHIEVIIVDDCSNDNTFEKLLYWQQNQSNIQVHRNEINIGYNKNFEKAIQLAKGDFITISDQDDIWLPQKIESSLHKFTNSNISLVHCKNVSLQKNKLLYKRVGLNIQMEGSDTRKLFLYGQISGHTMMFRRELLQYILPMPSGILYDLWISAIATCYGTICALPDILVYHRVHGNNYSLNTKSSIKKQELDIHETLQYLASIKTMKQDYKKCLLQLIQLIKERNQFPDGKLNWSLFQFLLRNRKVFFGHRKRMFPLISHIKHAYKIACINFIGKGKAF